MRNAIFVLLCFVMFCCSQERGSVVEPLSFKDVAIAELDSCIDRRLPHDVDTPPVITNKKDIINTDSAYACVFEMKFKNKFNGWSHSGFTFVCVQMDGKKKLCLIDKMDEDMRWAEIEGPYSNDYEKALNFCNCLFTMDYIEERP